MGNVIQFKRSSETAYGVVVVERQKRPKWPTTLAFSAFIGTGLAFIVVADQDGSKIDHVVQGTTMRDEKNVDYLAGLSTRCNENGTRPAVVVITSQLVTNPALSGGSERGRRVISQFIPGQNDCDDAIAEVYANPMQIVNAIEDNMNSINATLLGDGDFPTGKNFHSRIDSALKDGVPVIQG